MSKQSIDKIVPDYYYIYGKYVNCEKMIPLITDGLLPVHRRVLLSAHTIAKNKFVKTANAIGLVAGQWHPHDLGVGPFAWAVQNGFMEGDGQWGFDIGSTPIGPAAPRYTKIKSNDLIEEIAFKYIDYVEWKVGDLDHKEPICLPTMLPFCLMGKSEMITIGFGFKPQFPCFHRKDLIKRLMFLLGKTKKYVPIPYVEGCDIKSKEEEIEKLFTEGKGNIEIIGKYVLDEKDQVLRILGWSPRITFQTLEKRIDNYKNLHLLSEGLVGNNDDSSKTTSIRFEVIRKMNKKEIWESLKEAINYCLSSSLSYEIIICDKEDNVRLSSIDEILLECYNNFKKAFDFYLKNSIEKIKIDLDDLDIIEKIKNVIPSILKPNKSSDEIYEEISIKTKVNKQDIERICKKYRISNLLDVDTDKSELQEKRKEFENKLNNIDDEIISEYKDLYNKF